VTESELFAMLRDKPWLALLALVAWAELRFLPLVLDAIGWNRAVGAKVGVTEADALAHRPPNILTGLLARLFKRPPNGGPPPAAVLGVLAIVLALSSGCVSEADRRLLDAGVAGNMGHLADEELRPSPPVVDVEALAARYQVDDPTAPLTPLLVQLDTLGVLDDIVSLVAESRAGHAEAARLGRILLEVALDNADAWAALRLNLTGDELPPGARERLASYRRVVDGAPPVSDTAPVDTRTR
jgi:hypothetical protein